MGQQSMTPKDVIAGGGPPYYYPWRNAGRSDSRGSAGLAGPRGAGADHGRLPADYRQTSLARRRGERGATSPAARFQLHPGVRLGDDPDRASADRLGRRAARRPDGPGRRHRDHRRVPGAPRRTTNEPAGALAEQVQELSPDLWVWRATRQPP